MRTRSKPSTAARPTAGSVTSTLSAAGSSRTATACGWAADRMVCTSIRPVQGSRGSPTFSRSGRRMAASESSVIDPLDEPFVTGDIVEQFAQQVAVEHDLPVLTDDCLSPPLGLNLPAGDGIDMASPRAGDV